MLLPRIAKPQKIEENGKEDKEQQKIPELIRVESRILRHNLVDGEIPRLIPDLDLHPLLGRAKPKGCLCRFLPSRKRNPCCHSAALSCCGIRVHLLRQNHHRLIPILRCLIGNRDRIGSSGKGMPHGLHHRALLPFRALLCNPEGTVRVGDRHSVLPALRRQDTGIPVVALGITVRIGCIGYIVDSAAVPDGLLALPVLLHPVAADQAHNKDEQQKPCCHPDFSSLFLRFFSHLIFSLFSASAPDSGSCADGMIIPRML